MTPDDSANLQGVGIVILVNLANLSTVTFLHGIFTMVFSIAVYTTLRRGLKYRPTLAIFILIILSFIGATMAWAALVAFFAIQIRTELVDNLGMNLSDRIDLAVATTNTAALIQGFSIPFTRILNDIVVVWRAWVLFPDQKWVMVALFFFAFTTFAMTVADLVINMSISMPTMLAVHTEYSTIAVSMATNLLATSLIAYKLWAHRKSTRSLGLKTQKSHVQKILFVLVESGFLFLGLQLGSILLSLLSGSWSATPDTAADYAATVCAAFYVELAGMYPSLILIIVNKERSIAETIGFSTVVGNKSKGEAHTKSAEDRPATVGHLVFGSSNSSESLA